MRANRFCNVFANFVVVLIDGADDFAIFVDQQSGLTRTQRHQFYDQRARGEEIAGSVAAIDNCADTATKDDITKARTAKTRFDQDIYRLIAFFADVNAGVGLATQFK